MISRFHGKFPSALLDKGLFLTLAFVCAVGILTMPADQISGDAMSVRCETWELIHHGRFGVAENIALKTPGIQPGQFYFYNDKQHAWYPKFGFLNTLIYLPAMMVEKIVDEHLLPPHPPRVFYLNIHNLILSLGCTWIFYRIAGLFSVSQLVRALFTLCVIYTTFCWNHFRAQSFEIHQILLYSLALYFSITAIRVGIEKEERVHDGARKRYFLLVALLLSALVLVKCVYVLLVPLFGMALIAPTYMSAKTSPSERLTALRVWLHWFFLPATAGIALLLLLNTIRFGSPLTTGYGQWAYERDPMSGNLLEGVWGFLFSTQFGVFSCFPPLLLSLFYWRVFFKRFTRESCLIIGASLIILLINSKFIHWQGDCCYGPRYMLPVLPSMALPFALMIGQLVSKPSTYSKTIVTLATVIFLSCSLYMQVMVSKYPFFSWYTLDENFKEKSCIHYLDNRPRGLIFSDLDALHNGHHPFRPFTTVTPPPSAFDLKASDSFILRKTPLNYYWFR